MKKNVLVILEAGERPGRAQLIGILRHVNEAHLDWNLKIIPSRKEMSADVLSHAFKKSVDGVIIAVPGGLGVPERLARSKIPVVFLDVLPPHVPADRRTNAFLRIDDASIGHVAARHFLTLGFFRSYVFVHDPRAEIWSEERCSAFTEALAEKNRPCAIFTASADAKHDIVNELASFLRTQPPPIAVMAACDPVAAHVLQACREAGLAVPETVSVIGVDNDEALCERQSPRLSSIEPDFEEEGLRAARTLAAMFDVHTADKNATPSAVRLVERGSTKPLPPATRLVERALEFIEENYHKPVSVGDVVRHLGVSRRLADLRFRQLQNETILEALTKRRLEALHRLLRESSVPLNRLVRECGFGSQVRAARLFKARYGVSMSGYRKGEQPRQGQ